MAIYKISDILSMLNDMETDGFEYVELSEVENDEDTSTTLHIECIISHDETETDFIDAVELPKNYFCNPKQ